MIILELATLATSSTARVLEGALTAISTPNECLHGTRYCRSFPLYPPFPRFLPGFLIECRDLCLPLHSRQRSLVLQFRIRFRLHQPESSSDQLSFALSGMQLFQLDESFVRIVVDRDTESNRRIAGRRTHDTPHIPIFPGLLPVARPVFSAVALSRASSPRPVCRHSDWCPVIKKTSLPFSNHGMRNWPSHELDAIMRRHPRQRPREPDREHLLYLRLRQPFCLSQQVITIILIQMSRQ